MLATSISHVPDTWISYQSWNADSRLWWTQILCSTGIKKRDQEDPVLARGGEGRQEGFGLDIQASLERDHGEKQEDWHSDSYSSSMGKRKASIGRLYNSQEIWTVRFSGTNAKRGMNYSVCRDVSFRESGWREAFLAVQGFRHTHTHVYTRVPPLLNPRERNCPFKPIPSGKLWVLLWPAVFPLGQVPRMWAGKRCLLSDAARTWGPACNAQPPSSDDAIHPNPVQCSPCLQAPSPGLLETQIVKSNDPNACGVRGSEGGSQERTSSASS